MLAEGTVSIPQLRVDDRAAYARIVDAHMDALVNYLSMLIGCRSRAEDIAQETFVRLYLHAARYQEQGRLRGYLFRIATNLARSELRRERRQRWLYGALGHEAETASESISPYAALLGQERQRALLRTLERIPLRFRAPLLMYEVEGLSYAEIGQALELREGTVKSRISRARSALQQRAGALLKGGEDG